MMMEMHKIKVFGGLQCPAEAGEAMEPIRKAGVQEEAMVLTGKKGVVHLMETAIAVVTEGAVAEDVVEATEGIVAEDVVEATAGIVAEAVAEATAGIVVEAMEGIVVEAMEGIVVEAMEGIVAEDVVEATAGIVAEAVVEATGDERAGLGTSLPHFCSRRWSHVQILTAL